MLAAVVQTTLSLGTQAYRVVEEDADPSGWGALGLFFAFFLMLWVLVKFMPKQEKVPRSRRATRAPAAARAPNSNSRAGRIVPSAEARPTAAGRTTARWHTTPHWQSSAPEQDVAPASGVRLVEVRPVEAPATQLHAQTPGQSKDEYNVGDRSGRRGSARIKVA